MPAASSVPLFLEDTFMKVNYVLLISLLIVGVLFIPAVSAEIIIDEEIIDWEDTGGTRSMSDKPTQFKTSPLNRITFAHIEHHSDTKYVIVTISGNVAPEGRYEITYNLNGKDRPAVKHVIHHRNLLGTVTATRFEIFFDEWDIGFLTGSKSIILSEPFLTVGTHDSIGTSTNDLVWLRPENGKMMRLSYTMTVVSVREWKNHLTVKDYPINAYEISLEREIDNKAYASTITLLKDGVTKYSNGDSRNINLVYLKNEINGITLNSGVQTYTWNLTTSTPEEPTEPTEPTLRTGSVTMTDHNGTSISGFEVTAVNHYTGESHTVSTNTDVAVIDLPMDRMTEIRNPQTGVYEEVPIGYYKFYGQAPGYKMLYEDGIQVTVVPEKYSSYQLCNILVRSESGPLTGKHQFQIRSRADNSILQTGTISAKSATTGEWYNTSVSGGIATLILAYDTTSILSEYAGLYYVYATSPGYEDSDYGTQISVYPHTVSEVRWIHLTPIGGVPTPGNVTLRIQAISETGQGVVNAEIFIAGVLGAGQDVWNTYTASSSGYLMVSVPGNSTYDIVASGDGFYDSARRIEVFTEDPGLIELKLYLSGYPTLEPPTQPTGWPTDPPTQPTGGIPDDDDSDGFLVQAVRGIGLAFGVGFSTAKIIFGMLLALSIGFATAKQLRGGAAEFGIGLLGGSMLGVLIGLLPVWIVVVLMLVVGLYYGNRYVGGANSG